MLIVHQISFDDTTIRVPRTPLHRPLCAPLLPSIAAFVPFLPQLPLLTQIIELQSNHDYYQVISTGPITSDV